MTDSWSLKYHIILFSEDIVKQQNILKLWGHSRCRFMVADFFKMYNSTENVLQNKIYHVSQKEQKILPLPGTIFKILSPSDSAVIV